MCIICAYTEKDNFVANFNAVLILYIISGSALIHQCGGKPELSMSDALLLGANGLRLTGESCRMGQAGEMYPVLFNTDFRMHADYPQEELLLGAVDKLHHVTSCGNLPP